MRMARECCFMVWEYETNIQLLTVEEQAYAQMENDFYYLAGVYKDNVRGVYNTLNALWNAANHMNDTDNRKGVCQDFVARISDGWRKGETAIRQDVQGTCMTSRMIQNTSLRVVLENMLKLVSEYDVKIHRNMIWDKDCFDKLTNSYNEMVPRVMRMNDGDVKLRYCRYFGTAIKLLDDKTTLIKNFFSQVLPGNATRDISTDVSNLTESSNPPPHIIAFAYAAQLVHSPFLVREHRPLESALDLSVRRSEVTSTTPREMQQTSRVQLRLLTPVRNAEEMVVNETQSDVQVVSNDVVTGRKASSRLAPQSRGGEQMEPSSNEVKGLGDALGSTGQRNSPELVDLTQSPIKTNAPNATPNEVGATLLVPPEIVAKLIAPETRATLVPPKIGAKSTGQGNGDELAQPRIGTPMTQTGGLEPVTVLATDPLPETPPADCPLQDVQLTFSTLDISAEDQRAVSGHIYQPQAPQSTALSYRGNRASQRRKRAAYQRSTRRSSANLTNVQNNYPQSYGKIQAKQIYLLI